MMLMKKKIACLPVAGIKNPYQYLMIKGLNKSNSIFAFNGVNDRFFGIIRTYFKYRPHYIHFDWITSYYNRRKLWMTLLLLPFFCTQIYFIKIFTKTKIVWTLHNILPHDVDNKNLHIFIRRWFASKCDWIRVFSESSVHNAKSILKVDNNKFKVVPEGDYTSFYMNETNDTESRKILGICSGKKVLLYLGLIKPYKGLESLIDTFYSIENSNLILIIAGAPIDEDYSTFLKKKISDYNRHNVIYKDEFIPENELQYYFNASNFVVLPFDQIENSGSVIMAMGFKKAIIAPKLGVLVDRLKYQPQLLYENSLHEALLKIEYFHDGELKNIGELNFSSLKQYSWSDFGKNFIT